MELDEKLAFQSWEIGLLRSYAQGCNPDLESFLGILNDKIIGLVFFGQSGERASINHIWVAESQRGKGVSSQLLNAALNECSGKTVHLMTVNGNVVANAFFEGAGFKSDRGFWEMDIDAATEQVADENFLSAHVHILGLRTLLHAIPKESDWESLKEALYAKGIRRIHFIPPFGFSDTDRLTAMGFKLPEGETLWIKQV